MLKLKELLKQPLSFPKGVEVKLPKGMPSISGILASIADALPEGPDLPIPIQAAMPASFTFPRVSTFIKGVEEMLPEGMPKLAPMAVKLEAPTLGKVEEVLGMGGGSPATEAPTPATKPGIIPLVFE